MKKLLFSLMLFVALGLGSEVMAQGYNTGIGLRAGSGNGLTVKHFISQNAALEGILYTRWNGLIVAGLYEVHNDIREVKNLQWFYGGGAHIGTWNAGRGNTPWDNNRNRSYTVVGLDLIVGLDYKFEDAPINLSLDWKPTFNFFNDQRFWGDEVALSIRFTF